MVRAVNVDRRSMRTRQMLGEALVELIRTTRYESITVQKIVDQADVGRSTFYAHYTDKDDLLADGVQRMVAALDQAPATAGTASSRPFPVLALLHHIHHEAGLYTMLAKGRGLGLFEKALREELTAAFEARLVEADPNGRGTSVDRRLLAAMVTGMLVTAVRLWIESGFLEPAEGFATAFETVSAAAIAAGLGSPG